LQRSAGAGGGNEAEKFGYELNPQAGDARGLLEYNYIAKMTPHTQFCPFFFFAMQLVGSWLPDQGIKPVPPEGEAQSFNHWASRAVPV